MDVSPGELIGAGVTLAGIAATWGALSQRLKDQGRRIGAVEKQCGEMAGMVQGFIAGKRVRRDTKPAGTPSLPSE